jgi:hypothetical protein
MNQVSLPPLTVRPLVEVLRDVPDFRSRHGRRYELSSILALGCAALLCGYTSYGAMAAWGKNYGTELAQALGFKHGKTPSVGTLFTVFSKVDKVALETVLGRWAETLVCQLPGKKAASVDGKTLRGSAAQGAVDVHLLSVVSHELGLTLFQQSVDDKTNEIPVAKQVVEHLVLTGRVLTMDALLTQREFAEQIVSLGGTS